MVIWRWGKREIIYLSLHRHHHNDSCIKTGSDENHFKVSLTCEGHSHKTVSTDNNFSRERRAEAESTRGPSSCNVLPLGQTDSPVTLLACLVTLMSQYRSLVLCPLLYILRPSGQPCMLRLLSRILPYFYIPSSFNTFLFVPNSLSLYFPSSRVLRRQK